jgi:hypothetical protein
MAKTPYDTDLDRNAANFPALTQKRHMGLKKIAFELMAKASEIEQLNIE